MGSQYSATEIGSQAEYRWDVAGAGRSLLQLGMLRLAGTTDEVCVGEPKALSERPKTTLHLRGDRVVPFW